MYKKLLFPVLGLTFLVQSGFAQLNSQYNFFKGDTLQGFDVQSAFNDALILSRYHNLSDKEMTLQVYNAERRFVKAKYSNPSQTSATPRKPITWIPSTTNAACNNADFEAGTFANWTGAKGYNTNSTTALTVAAAGIFTSGVNSAETSCSYHTLVNTGTDPYSGLPMVDPGGGTWACRLGGEDLNLNSTFCTPADGNVLDAYSSGETIQTSFVVSAANAMFTYNYSVLLDAAPHNPGEMPYFRAEVLDAGGNPLPCLQYYIQSATGSAPAGFLTSGTTNAYTLDNMYYCPWTSNALNLTAYIGSTLTVRFTAAGCIYGGHAGWAYVDCRCSPVQMLSTTPDVCLGGTITLTAPGAGGTGTYAWNTMPTGTAGIVGSTTGQSVTINANGTYQITVTQGPGCTYTIDTTLTFYPLPVPTATSTNATCTPGHDGTASVTVTGGNTPYTYNWSPAPGGGQGTANATGLNAGTYTCTVTTTNGCTASTTVTITTPSGPASTPATTPVKCFGGSDGTATANVTGGTAPYTYSWAPAATGTAATSTGLPAGTYTCTIKDNNGCVLTQAVTVTQPTVLAATNTQINVLCNGGNNGSISVTPTGGTTPYTYSWNPAPAAGTGATAGTLTAGTYTCTITDANGCITTSIATITQPAPLTSTTSNTPSTCGGSNGSATVTPAGGTGAYTYAWAPAPAAGTAATASNLSAGTYTCTVTDANGCVIKPTVVVTTTGGPTTTMGPATNVTCFGLCNGSLTATATGGTAPLTYSWSPAPGAGQGTLTASSLCPGTYTMSTTDSHGCVTSATGTITQPTAIVVTLTSTNVSCFGGNNGTASATVSGGTPAYTYTWAPVPGAGQGTLNATTLTAATYTFTVTDASGCTQTGTTTVTQPAALTMTAAGINATCNGVCNGQVICIPAGGTPAYTYSWSPGITCASASCNNICPGTYTSNVTDSKGCTITATATVTEPTPIVLTMFPKAAHCNHPDGADSVFASGGTPGYTYTWKPSSPVVTTPGIHNIPTGNYCVLIHDSQGCADSICNVVPNLPGVNITVTSTTNVNCFGGNDGSATVAGSSGTLPYTFSWSPLPATGTATTANNLTAGTYTAYIQDSAHCPSQVTFTITQPPPLTLTAMPPVTICIGQCTPLTATAGGGSPAYTYSWTLNGTPVTSPVCPIVTTTYTVTCTDSHGCVGAPATVVITVYPPLEVTLTPGKSVCPNGCDTLHATATGGNGNYSYAWQPAAGLSSTIVQNPVACPAGTTTYTCIVSDNCGTPTDSAAVTVTIYPAPVVTFTSADTVTCAPMCASFVGASNPPCASAVWQFGDGSTATGCNTARHCYATAGTYTVTYSVIDIHGCPGSLSIPNFINALPRPEAAFTANPNPATILNPTIYFTDQSTNAFTWAWTFGDKTDSVSSQTNPFHTYLDTGCYNVLLIVTSANGCTDSIMNPVCIQPDFTFYAPNTFTPNGDGKNDVWSPKGIGIDPNHYDLMMFDRWGNLMFETHTWGEGWDGRANGGSDIAQIDTYVWKVKLLDFRGNKHQYEGHCNIIK
ncbi:MAG: PKD domain-containing protein [Bacteroidia bacterium]